MKSLLNKLILFGLILSPVLVMGQTSEPETKKAQNWREKVAKNCNSLTNKAKKELGHLKTWIRENPKTYAVIVGLIATTLHVGTKMKLERVQKSKP